MPLDEQQNSSELPEVQPEATQHYAVSKTADTARIITLAVEELPGMRVKMGNLVAVKKERAKGIYEDIQKIRAKLVASLTQAYLSLEEMDETDLAAHTAKLITSVKAFNLMTPDYSRLCDVLNSYKAKLPAQNQTVSAKVIGRLMNRVKMGHYPTDPEHIGHIERAVAFPEGVTTNLLDPCCGRGSALRALAEGNNCYTYGVELDESRAEEAQTKLHRVGFGNFFYSRISSEAFHAMLLNPPYLSVLSENGQNFRSEKRFLADSICHLMIGGLLIYIVPYYRLTEDVCRVLSDNFQDISVWRFFGGEFKKFKQVAVMGLRKKRESCPEHAAVLADTFFQIESIPELSAIPDDRYPLPANSMKVELFKGAVFNVPELANQLKNSKSFAKLFQNNKLDDKEKRPLLPLSIGHIGLIGGAGLINGYMECSTPHIIKGRIIKETITRENMAEDSDGRPITTIHETVTNKMVFNILTPQGFKSLA